MKTDRLSQGGFASIETPTESGGRTPPLDGTHDWQQQTIEFRVPSPGRVTVALYNCDPDHAASGRIWFDDVRLSAEPEPARRSVKIFPDKLNRLPIDLKQEGQFIEHLCNLVPSMLAQQVKGDSFEEEPAWKYAYKKEVDKPYRPWYPEGSVHVAQYSLDQTEAFNGKRSQKIVLPLPHSRAGIAQDGFYLRTGLNYRLRLHMKGIGNVPVWASLRVPGGVVAGPVLLGHATGSWEAAEAQLRASSDSGNATLVIESEGPGTLWLDRVYLIGEDAVLGIWRPDVVQALRDLNPGVIRFGGTFIEKFEWDQSVGDWDQRAPYTTIWGGLEANFIGIEEFTQFCQHVGAEPLICVRWTGKKPEDAAAEVEYMNGAVSTHWGGLRAQNGHPKPYGVKYWQVGNEVGGAEYDDSVGAFARAMKQADPSIKVLTAYPSARTLEQAGGAVDYLCPHHYGSGDLQGKRRNFDFLRGLIDRSGSTGKVRVAVTEWNTTAGDFGLARGMLQTLGNALDVARYHNLMHRYSDLVEISIRSNLIDSLGSGILVTGPGWIFLSPAYYAQQLYTRAAGSFPLRIEREDGPACPLDEPDLSATISPDGKRLRIYSVNSTAEPTRVQFHLERFATGVAGGVAHVLEDSENRLDSEAMNSAALPDRVRVVTRSANASGRDPEYVFDPFSVTLLELDLAQ
jgi:alpha-N-arabinofuranosidase